MQFPFGFLLFDALEPRTHLSSNTDVRQPFKKDDDDKKVPNITVLLGNTPLVDSGSLVDFGHVSRNEGPVVRTFTIRNEGRKSLKIGSITTPNGFTLIDAPAGSVGKNSTTTFTVRLDNGTTGQRGGTIAFTTNDPDTPLFNFTLRGMVDPPPPPPPPPPPVPQTQGALATLWLVRPNRSSLAITDGQSSPISFGTTTVNSRAPRWTFRVMNEGDVTMNLGALSVPQGCVILEGLSASIAPGASDTFTLAMQTSTAANRSGEVRFATSDPARSLFNFPISGTVSPAPASTGRTPSSSFSGGTLTLRGTPGNDSFALSGKSGVVYVTLNDAPLAGNPFTGVAKVIVNSGDGNDSVSLSRLFINCTANAGPGADTLVGSAGNDVLNGEDGDDSIDGQGGDDVLLGGGGNDILIGGFGIDAFNGEAGNDTVSASDGIADRLLDGGDGSDIAHRDRTDPMLA